MVTVMLLTLPQPSCCVSHKLQSPKLFEDLTLTEQQNKRVISHYALSQWLKCNKSFQHEVHH